MRVPNPDIRAWLPAERSEYLERLTGDHFSGSTAASPAPSRLTFLQIDAAQIYALLTVYIADQPNGLFTMLLQAKPLSSLVWWDFVLTCDSTMLHIMRTAHVLEARLHDSDLATLDFDPEIFLRENIAAYEPIVAAQLERFERHTVYVNHYESYRQCVEWLWSELRDSRPEPPLLLSGHLVEKAVADDYFAREKAFLTDSHKFHVLGKSLILHCAFMAEACLNTLFRLGAARPLLASETAMKQLLRANFAEKLKLLRGCTFTFNREPDMRAPAVKGALELMELRNKYVHADQSSRHNTLAEVRFDDLFPLQPVSGYTPGVEFALRAFHNPDWSKLEVAYSSAHEFCRYLLELVHPRYRDEMRLLIEQPQIGFNHSKNMYSVVYPLDPFTFLVSPEYQTERKA